MEFYVTTAKTKSQTYFIFRENGTEVEVQVSKGFHTSHPLYEEELEYFSKVLDHETSYDD